MGRDRDHLFPQLLSKAACSDLLSIHKYNLVKVPKVPSQVEQLPLYGFQMRLRSGPKEKFDNARKEKLDIHAVWEETPPKINRAALHTHCCVNQKTPYLRIEKTGNELNSHRVINYRLKEHFLACRKLRQLHKNQELLKKHHDFVHLNSEAKEEETSQDQEFWEEMIRSKENPIFHNVPLN